MYSCMSKKILYVFTKICERERDTHFALEILHKDYGQADCANILEQFFCHFKFLLECGPCYGCDDGRRTV